MNWLRGDDCGFIQFMPYEKQRALWEAHGEHDNYFWQEGMNVPERK